MDKIFAPFTDQQVKNINKFQQSGAGHRFTCCNDKSPTGEAIQTATKAGMVCPYCNYVQNWVWDAMADGQLVNQHFGKPAKVNCDGNCKKAWGINNRPFVQISSDEDDTVFLADHELGVAPKYPGTYEGGHTKPRSKIEFPNKWCVRECERCNMSKPGMHESPLAIKSFENRVYNIEQETC